jgi:hypothetical protein
MSYVDNILLASTAALKTGNTDLRSFLQYIISRAGNLAKDKQVPLNDELMLTTLKKEKKELTSLIELYVSQGADLSDLSLVPLELFNAIQQRDIVDTYLPAVFTQEEMQIFLCTVPTLQNKKYYMGRAKQYEVEQGKIFNMFSLMLLLDQWMKVQ